MKNTIIVTGGSGFLGSNFIKTIMDRKLFDSVINIDRAYGASPVCRPGHDGYEFIKADINDKLIVTNLLAEYQPKAVVNFAAETDPAKSAVDPDLFIQTNFNGTASLLECAKNYCMELSPATKDLFRFVQISTDEIYGPLNPGQPPFTENSPHKARSIHAASKIAADELVRSYHHSFHLPTLTAVISNVYGPGQSTTKLIPRIIMGALSGQHDQTPLMYHSGKQTRDWLYVDDCSLAILKLLESGTPGDTYNVGANNERSNSRIMVDICDLMDMHFPRQFPYSSLFRSTDQDYGHEVRAALNIGKLTKLGWSPTIDFDEGVSRTINHFIKVHRGQ